MVPSVWVIPSTRTRVGISVGAPNGDGRWGRGVPSAPSSS